jgi:hypothetical protein
MGLSGDSKLKDIMENENGKAIMEKHIPGITKNPMLKMGYGMTLKQIAGYPQTNIGPEKLQAIIDDLSKL